VAEGEAEAVLPPSHDYGCCVAVIVIVLRSDNYVQERRDMEVEVALGSGTARQNDSLVVPSEHVQVVLQPRGARAAVAAAAVVAARESQDDEISLREGRCGRFLAVDSRNAM